jgi:hypothetical protein
MTAGAATTLLGQLESGQQPQQPQSGEALVAVPMSIFTGLLTQVPGWTGLFPKVPGWLGADSGGFGQVPGKLLPFQVIPPGGVAPASAGVGPASTGPQAGQGQSGQGDGEALVAVPMSIFTGLLTQVGGWLGGQIAGTGGAQAGQVAGGLISKLFPFQVIPPGAAA